MMRNTSVAAPSNGKGEDGSHAGTLHDDGADVTFLILQCLPRVVTLHDYPTRIRADFKKTTAGWIDKT